MLKLLLIIFLLLNSLNGIEAGDKVFKSKSKRTGEVFEYNPADYAFHEEASKESTLIDVLNVKVYYEYKQTTNMFVDTDKDYLYISYTGTTTPFFMANSRGDANYYKNVFLDMRTGDEKKIKEIHGQLNRVIFTENGTVIVSKNIKTSDYDIYTFDDFDIRKLLSVSKDDINNTQDIVYCEPKSGDIYIKVKDELGEDKIVLHRNGNSHNQKRTEKSFSLSDFENDRIFSKRPLFENKNFDILKFRSKNNKKFQTMMGGEWVGDKTYAFFVWEKKDAGKTYLYLLDTRSHKLYFFNHGFKGNGTIIPIALDRDRKKMWLMTTVHSDEEIYYPVVISYGRDI